MVKDNTRAAGTRIKSNSCSKITWSLFWNFSQVNIEGEWKTSTVTGPYADTLSISFSAMFFFTSKYSWVSLYPVLSRTCHELPNLLPNKQRRRPDEQPWVYFVLVLRGSHWTWVTKSEDIQATQQLNSTKLKEPGDKRKAESQPEVFAGKSKRDRKYQTSWERDFPWLVHDEEKNTMKSRLGFMLGIKVRRHKYWKFNETASKASWWFFGGNQKIHSASKTSDIVAQRAS